MIARVSATPSGAPTPTAWLIRILRDSARCSDGRDDHIAQRADAGIHAIRANPALDDLFDRARMAPQRNAANARASAAEFKRLAGGERSAAILTAPVERTIGTDDGHDGTR